MSVESCWAGELAPKPSEPRPEDEIVADWQNDLETPLVSFVCHTYNHAGFIKDALNGFLIQDTTFPFEIILNDDASTDGTREIVKEYQRRYPRLIHATLHEKNQFSKGLSPRNFSFPKVRGKYIAMCEGDDYWISPNKIQEQVDAFQPGVSIVFHDALPISGEKLLDNSYYSKGAAPFHGYTPNQMARGCKIPTASSLFISWPFQKEKHENIVNGDHLIWATLAPLGPARFLPKAYSVYRYHPDGIWSSISVLDKIEPALRSKKVIFNCVERKFKTSAMLGFCAVSIDLIDKLTEAGQYSKALSLMKLLYFQVIRMLPHCRLRNFDNLREIVSVVRILGVWIPKKWMRIMLR